MTKYTKVLFVLCLGCLLLTACSSKTGSTRYYLLEATGKPLPGENTNDTAPVIGLGPVNFPEYLDRRQMVMRDGSTEVTILDGHRWAEPLEENFTRVLAQNLSTLNMASRVIVYPSRQWSQVQRQVSVDVNRFDSDNLGRIILEAQLTFIKDGDPATAVSSSTRLLLNYTAAGSYANMVQVMGKLVYELAEQITVLISDGLDK